jgi:hypothetical protein
VDGNILKTIFNNSRNIRFDYFLPVRHQIWEWRQVFYNKLTGETFFCSCFEKAINKKPPIEPFTVKDTILRNTFKSQKFKDSVCHLCRGKPSDLFFCHPMYGSDFKVRYGAYIKKTEYELDIEEREAENIVREKVGVPKIGEKWINETLLYNYIVSLLGSNEVLREASPEWLGNQRLDMYIPSLNLAIEYQGEQHFHPVTMFGGEGGLIKARERDEEKRKKCEANKVKLVYFTYKEHLNEKLVYKKLKEFI